MKRVVSDHRALFLIVGTLLAVTGVAWGAGSSLPARSTQTASKAKASRVTAQAKPVGKTKATVAASQVAGAQGMRIVRVDDGTGVAPDRAARQQALSQSAKETRAAMQSLKVVVRPDGSKMMDLQGQFQESMIMKLDSHGKRYVECVQNAQPSDVTSPVSEAQVAAPKKGDK
jgi:hypothetical protein